MLDSPKAASSILGEAAKDPKSFFGGNNGQNASANNSFFSGNQAQANQPAAGFFQTQNSSSNPEAGSIFEQPGAMNTEKTEQPNVFVESAKKAKEENKNPLDDMVKKPETSLFFLGKAANPAGSNLFDNHKPNSLLTGHKTTDNPFLNTNSAASGEGTGLGQVVGMNKTNSLFGSLPKPQTATTQLFANLNQNPAAQQTPGLFNFNQTPTTAPAPAQSNFFNSLQTGQQTGLFGGPQQPPHK